MGTLLCLGRRLLLKLFIQTLAFLFTLNNPSNNPVKLKVIEPQNAVCHDLTWGPVFGRQDLNDRDLSFYSFESSINENRMNFKSYESPDG